jgi:hypothetical protein
MSDRAPSRGFHLVNRPRGTDSAPVLAARDASTNSSFAGHDLESENCCVVVGLVPLIGGSVAIVSAVLSLRKPRAPNA